MLGREIIGQYVIVAKLGEGGMGEVYLADQPAIGRQVAIKVVHSQTRERDHDELVERFRNEAKAAASLESPHIVSIFNWGELEDGTLFMAMEYLPGKTLAEVIREQGSLEPEQAVTIASQICVALSEAHAAGIVHRDLKPSNIMLLERRADTRDGDPLCFAKVLDFGVAKLEGSDITRSGAMFGTPQYMSPEQLRGESLDGRSDLYSLGVLLFEMLAGELPFASPTAVGFITAHLHESPPALPGSVPKGLAQVVMHLLAKEPGERPDSAEAVAEELSAVLGGRTTTAQRLARRQQRRRLTRRLIFAGLGVAMIGGLGYVGSNLWTRQQEIQAELEQERARATRLREQIDAQKLAIEEASKEAHRLMSANQAAAEKMALEREKNRKRPEGASRDAETRHLIKLTEGQLETILLEELGGRSIPPSEIAKVVTDSERRKALREAGELDEDELRGDLVEEIRLYRERPRKLPGDDLSLGRLERIYLSVNQDKPEQAKKTIENTYAQYDRDASLSEEDRLYYKQILLASLIRKQVDAKALDQTLSLGKPPAPAKPVAPILPGPDEPFAASGAEPEAGADGDEGAVAPQPRLPGLQD
nr:serine/threonine-protein kinase [Pseudenhygromyxa sp. WMMC2535]